MSAVIMGYQPSWFERYMFGEHGPLCQLSIYRDENLDCRLEELSVEALTQLEKELQKVRGKVTHYLSLLDKEKLHAHIDPIAAQFFREQIKGANASLNERIEAVAKRLQQITSEELQPGTESLSTDKPVRYYLMEFTRGRRQHLGLIGKKQPSIVTIQAGADINGISQGPPAISTVVLNH